MVRMLKTLLLPKSLTSKLHPTWDWVSSIQTLSWRKGRDEKYEMGEEGREIMLMVNRDYT